MTNLRKAAQMIGMDWNDMGECLVNDRARKRKRGNGLNLKYIPKVLDICKQWRIINISVISTKWWIGDYGWVANNLHVFNYYNADLRFDTDPKLVYKFLRNLHNVHNAKKWKVYEDEYGLNWYYYFPEGIVNTIKYGSGYRDELIVLQGGQVFDVGNIYWFTYKDSHKLTKEIKKGYEYIEPQYFFSDFNEGDEE
nr:MAG TPA: hypothetical protein [Caudoviricetes sp.]